MAGGAVLRETLLGFWPGRCLRKRSTNVAGKSDYDSNRQA
jgi:hypothetical protein